MAERIHGERVEVGADEGEQAEGDEGQRKKIENGTWPSVEDGDGAEECRDRREAEQARMRQPPHAEPLDKPGVGEGADCDQSRSGGEGEREERSEAVEIRVDLLRRIEEPEQAAENEAVADRVAGGQAVGDDDREGLVDRPGPSSRRFSAAQRLRQAEVAPAASCARPNAAMKTRMARQPATIMMPWPMVGAMIGTTMNTIIASDMTLAIRRPPKVSRTTEIAITRVAPAPIPWMARIASSIVKLAGERPLRCSRAT